MKDEKGRRFSLVRLLLLGLGSVAAIRLLWLAIPPGIKSLFITTDSLQGLEAEQSPLSLEDPINAIPSETEGVAPNAAEETLSEEDARKIVETWLSVKRSALGKDHQIALLDRILAKPLLGKWRDRAESLQQENVHLEYEHTVRVENVDFNAENPNVARVDVLLRETARAFRGGKPDLRRSYDDILRVRYELVRQNNVWRIRSTTIL